MQPAKYTRLLLFVAITALAVSCSKDPVTEPIVNPQPGSSLLNRIEQDPLNYMSMEYTSDSLVNKLKLVTDSFIQDAVFAYNSQKKPSQVVMNGIKASFIYVDGVLDKVELTSDGNPNAPVLSYLKFDYLEGKPRLTRVYSKQDSNFVNYTQIVYEYFDNGDIKTMTTLEQTSPGHYDMSERVTYEYDNKPNPLKIANEAMLVLFINNPAHNIIKQSEYDSDNRLVQTSTYTYQYNASGYPVKGTETIQYQNAPASTRNITYSYQ